MQSTQPSSDEWSDDAIKTLLAYAGWDLEWSDDDGMWMASPPHQIVAALFHTLQDVHEYFLYFSKWHHNDYDDVSKS